MTEPIERSKAVQVEQEFSACPACDYDNGFHVGFVPSEDGQSLRLLLMCPSCHARFDVGKCM